MLSIVEQDTQLTRVSSHRSGEYHGPCPFCGGSKRFRVQPDYGESGFWRCRDCERSGDLIAYLVESGRIDKRQAYKIRHSEDIGDVSGSRRKRAPSAPKREEPPCQEWQARAWAFVAWSQGQLEIPTGSKARQWLQKRGLNERTITRSGYRIASGSMGSITTCTIPAAKRAS